MSLDSRFRISARLVRFSESLPANLAEVLKELGAGDSRFSGTSFGRGECDLPTFLQECGAAEAGRDLPPDRVPQTTYGLVNDSELVAGIVRLRHRLNARLLQYGGHIGYYVCPSDRGKGYGTVALRLALDESHRMGIERVLLTVNPTNAASRRVIIANGGTLDEPGVDAVTGEVVDRYWIECMRPNNAARRDEAIQDPCSAADHPTRSDAVRGEVDPPKK